MPRTGLEPAHPCEHRPLKAACLPVPPPRRACPVYYEVIVRGIPNSATSAYVPWGRLELTHPYGYTALNGACLPIPAPGPEVEFTLSEAESDSAKSKGHFGILSASTSALRNFSINDIFAKAHVNSNTHYQYFVLGVYNRL